MRRAAGAALGLALLACGRSPEESAAPEEPAPRPLLRCFADRPPWSDASVAELLERAGKLLDDGDAATALACAEEAVRQAPRSLEAHENRALALAQLGRAEEAQDAVALALAIAPDDAYTLETATEVYLNHLPPSRDRTAVALEYARRAGRLLRRKRGEQERRARVALLEGQAQNDLGRAGEALRTLEAALAFRPEPIDARFEHGVALFALCRFPEAQRDFERVVATDPGYAHAHHHLGLLAERAGDEAAAARSFAEARRLDPHAFPPVPEVSPADFAARVQAAVAALPEPARGVLGAVPVETADTPLLDDLVAEKPPLAPTILGLFRGLPLGAEDECQARQAARGSDREAPKGEPAGPPCTTPERAIVLYRRNLLRTVTDTAALDAAITRTLLHEVGHLQGEDDGSLHDRGLE